MKKNLLALANQIQLQLDHLRREIERLPDEVPDLKPAKQPILGAFPLRYLKDRDRIYSSDLYQQWLTEEGAPMSARLFNMGMQEAGFVKMKNAERIPGRYQQVYFLAPYLPDESAAA